MSNTIETYKGFDKDLRCRGFQYEIGKEYDHEGEVLACNAGYHGCERPLDVFAYYPPATSRYCKTEQSGDLSRDSDDSKVASSHIKIGAEIGIVGLVKAHIEYVKSHTTMEHTDPKMATAGDSGAATSRGRSAVGEEGLAVARGNGVKVKGGMGALLVLCEENDGDYGIKEWLCVVVDGDAVKPDTWYCLKNGELQEVEEE